MALGPTSCASPVEARSPGQRPLAASGDAGVFVVAAREKGRAVEALDAAGVRVVEDLLDADYLLRVTVGVPQGALGCGAHRNAKFSLRHDGTTVLELVAKGPTGSCRPHVFDDLSRRLALELGVAAVRPGATK